MGYKVIIAEKPSVAGSIAKIVGATTPHRSGPTGYLEGGGWRVTWAFGHLVGLQSPEQMGFAGGVLPMFPDVWRTKVNGKRGGDGKEKADELTQKQLKTIEELFGGADSIVVATDAGREGELIFRYIYEHLGCSTPFRRLWISSLTDEAIRKGLSEVRDGHDYDALSDAAHCRSRADWLVGYNASRALRLYTGFRGNVSLGRVQTPTLALICKRTEDNRDFVATPYWQIKVAAVKDTQSFTALSDIRYAGAAECAAARAAVEAAGTLTVTAAQTRHRRERPPLLHDLTSLQRAANGRHGLTAEATLRAAQSLYEQKLLSYPRTGSRYIPEDVMRTIPSLLRRMEGYGVLGRQAAALADAGHLCRRSVDDAKVTDHHALLPTGNMPGSLSGDMRQVYDLVVERLLEAFGEDYECDTTTVRLTAAGHGLTARGSVPTKMGWKGVRGTVKDVDDGKDDDEDDSQRLPPMTAGDTADITAAEDREGSDKAPALFTDSTLLGEMETCGRRIDDEEMRERMKDVGLGTPATRAATIETLIARGYVERQGRRLLPTDLGMQIYAMVKGRRIADVATTGAWEAALYKVEKGLTPARDFDDGIRRFVEEILADLKANSRPLEGASDKPRKCPLCGNTMTSRRYSIECPCGMRIGREVAGKKLSDKVLDALCDKGVTPLIKGFTGKSGKTFDARLKIDREQKKAAFDFGGVELPDGAACPCCGAAVTGAGGRVTCSCGFTMYLTIGGRTLTAAQAAALLAGKSVEAKGLTSKAGKKFDATLKVDKDRKKVVMDFKNKGGNR